MKNFIKLSLMAVVATSMATMGMTTMASNPSSFPLTPNASAQSAQVDGQVDINQATLEQLESLKGIGQKLAHAIISYRTSNGPFKTLDDLVKVPRLSQKLLAKILNKNPSRLICKQ